MQTYKHFVNYYDEIVRWINSPLHEEIDFLLEYIREYKPNSEKILEFACWTGVVAKELISKWYDVKGLDINENMLKIAKKNIWEQNAILWDMKNTRLEGQFDVVLCNYNSICHLLDFNDWKLTFENAYNHLFSGGLFIYDCWIWKYY